KILSENLCCIFFRYKHLYHQVPWCLIMTLRSVYLAYDDFGCHFHYLKLLILIMMDFVVILIDQNHFEMFFLNLYAYPSLLPSSSSFALDLYHWLLLYLMYHY
ncbi:unnamed protein product, partial [Meganyctiphanes norvegica]